MFARIATLCIAVVMAAAGASAEPIELKVSTVVLNPENPTERRVGRLLFLGGLALRSERRAFGGLSGLTLAPSGDRVIAVSDRGYWFTARLIESEDGRLEGLTETEYAPILDDGGAPLGGRWRDAEAVEIGPAGSFFVSFERHHRIWRYDTRASILLARPVQLRQPPTFRAMPSNGGIEALTVLSGGELLALSEDGRDQNDDRLGWILHLGRSTPVSLRANGEFRPTDLTVLPDGDLALLERRFSYIGGLAIRISRIPRSAIRPNAVLVSQEIAVLERPLTIDNFEGIAAAPAPDGGAWIYLLSDDNFKAVQRTVMLKFQLEGAGG